jgi:hypothetical protein
MTHRNQFEIPPELYEHLTAAENTDKAVEAMKLFLREGDEEQCELAVAIYVASARSRREQIETVASALSALAGVLETPPAEEILMRPSRLHQLLFSGILRAFYGDVAVDRALGASAQRKADAPQHTRSGTWPTRPYD